MPWYGGAMEAEAVAQTLLRLWLGVVMVAHGWKHARSLDGTTRWFSSVGFRHAGMNALASAVGEIAVGAALMAGTVTAVAAAGLIAMVTVAFGAIHRFAGFFVFHRPDEGWEYVATLVAAALAVAALGPGPYSLDAFLGIDESLAGWAGLLIAGGGVVVGVLHLAFLWRRPTSEPH